MRPRFLVARGNALENQPRVYFMLKVALEFWCRVRTGRTEARQNVMDGGLGLWNK